jgi:hypothetical protein
MATMSKSMSESAAATMTASSVAQPLLRSGARYTVELARCVLFGVVASALCAAAFFWLSDHGGAVHRGLVVVLSALVFPVLYALVGHQRGLGRALASLTRSHGGFLYDHTLGRFLDTIEARGPGAVSTAVSSPQRLVQAFRVYLHESPAMPRLIRRVALRYVEGLSGQIDASVLSQDNMLVDGRLNAAALKHWAVERMHGQFMPTWKSFGIVLGLQVVVIGALTWVSR